MKNKQKTLRLPKNLERKLEQRQREKKEAKATQEYKIIATIGEAFGYQAVKDLLGIGCIDHGQGTKPCECMPWSMAEELLKAISSIHASKKIEDAQIAATASVAANSKSPDKVMKSLLSRYKERI